MRLTVPDCKRAPTPNRAVVRTCEGCWLRSLGSGGMGGLEAVIAHGTCGGESDVDDRGPALEFVVAVAVEQIRYADRGGGTGGFDSRESRMIVDNVVGQQDFLAPTMAHVERRKIVEGARSAHTSKEPVVGPVPKAVLAFGREGCSWRGSGGRGGLALDVWNGHWLLGEEILRYTRRQHGK
jgi:hypothetical protein